MGDKKSGLKFSLIKPIMPLKPKGFAGLGALLRHIIELKFYEEEVRIKKGLPALKKQHTAGGSKSRMSDIEQKVRNNYLTKMHELSEIKGIITHLKRRKNELVSNIMLEQNFQLSLRTNKTTNKQRQGDDKGVPTAPIPGGKSIEKKLNDIFTLLEKG
jgi:hypothetical protein